MTADFIKLARAEVAGMKPYVGGRPIEEVQRELGIEQLVKLASNENPRGPSQRVQSAMQLAAADVNRYPDGNGYYLKSALAERHGLAAECITLGNGSNDVLELIATAYLRPGFNAVYSQYAFIVYPMVIGKSGAEARVVDALQYGHDLPALTAACDADTRVLFLANPNNPTGSCFSAEQLRPCLEQVPSETLVVLDEAYHDYAADLFGGYPDSEQLLREFPNLIVTRSFSKVYGLAGLRLGYSLSHPDVADVLNRARQPFNVNSLALAAALAALEDQAYIDDSVSINRHELGRVQSGLQALGIETLASAANFLTLDCQGADLDAGELEAKMLQRGVILRGLQPYAMPGHLRVSIGLEQENDVFLQQLTELLA